jgi:xylan 1,4-beta-xylosidase
MLSWSFEFENHDYFEGFRSLSTNGIDKPILNLFRMLALMTGERVSTTSEDQIPLDQLVAQGASATADIDAMATKGPREVDVLLWNYHDEAKPAPDSPVTVTVRGLPSTAHRVLIAHYRIDEAHSNAYTVWKAMGQPQHPTAEQVADLKDKAGLQLLTSPIWTDTLGGQLRVPIIMPRESVSLLRITW